MNDDAPKKERSAPATPTAEQRLWRALRGRRLNDRKFHRKYDVDGFTVDFACVESGLAIDLIPDPGSEPTPKIDEKKIKALKSAKMRLLRFTEEDVQKQFEKTLQHIWRETEETVKRPPPR